MTDAYGGWNSSQVRWRQLGYKESGADHLQLPRRQGHPARPAAPPSEPHSNRRRTSRTPLLRWNKFGTVGLNPLPFVQSTTSMHAMHGNDSTPPPH